MANMVKTIVATGCSSGIGFEAIKQLLALTQPHRFILGARDTTRVKDSLKEVAYDSSKHELVVLPLQLSDLVSVRSFAQHTLSTVGSSKIDHLLLCAATSLGTDKPSSPNWKSKWSEAYVTNHLSQHYLLHLLRAKLMDSQSRIIFVSSGAIRNVRDTSTLESDMLENSGQSPMEMYPKTKFVQFLGAQYWRHQLLKTNVVVAVSPGLIPGTGLGRGSGQAIPHNLPDAKTVPEGAQSILRALDVTDIPTDPEQMFLTSWGEWWPKDVYSLALDRPLQERFSPPMDAIEADGA